MHQGIHKRKGGYITVLVLVFAGVFFVIMTSLAGYIFLQNKLQLAKENREKAGAIAEAGLDYYKWFLSHFPDDLQDGTGVSGPYEHTYSDPEGGDIGTFSLDITGNTQCGVVTSVDITSTGWSDADSSLTRVIFGRYAKPSVAEYAFIINTDVWAGEDNTIIGRFHSNGGIRMDSENESLVESAVSSWTCTATYGCDPDETKDGVFGSATNSQLWQFPVAQVDFAGITADLSTMRTLAQSSGIYLGDSGAYGYHVVFQSDGTLDVYTVTNVGNGDWGYSSQWGWEQEYNTILSETFLQSYTPPSDCSLIFVADKLWVEGTVNGKVTIASADLDDTNVETDIIIQGNIDYTALNGNDGLTAIAEEDILIPAVSPDDLLVRGIYIAQTGHFGRNYYDAGVGYNPDDAYKNSFTMSGTVVSYGRVGTKWDCGGVYCSGYNTRSSSYDRTQAKDPPPLTPYTSDTYMFIDWREEL